MVLCSGLDGIVNDPALGYWFTDLFQSAYSFSAAPAPQDGPTIRSSHERFLLDGINLLLLPFVAMDSHAGCHLMFRFGKQPRKKEWGGFKRKKARVFRARAFGLCETMVRFLISVHED